MYGVDWGAHRAALRGALIEIGILLTRLSPSATVSKHPVPFT